MLDYKFIRDNLDLVEENIRRRQVKADAAKVVALYRERCALEAKIDELRKKRNENASAMKQKLEEPKRQELIKIGQSLKEQIAQLEEELLLLEKELQAEAYKIPNLTHVEVPPGKEEQANRELKCFGQLPSFNFKPRDHLELATELGIVDFETAQKVSGQKWYYLKDEGVLLELALVRYALDVLKNEGFKLFQTPDVARLEIVEGIGFSPRGPEANIYKIEDEDLCLIGTAEITLGGAYTDSILAEEELPLRLAGISHCFRKEAGAAGQFSKGLYRVHQFTKVEMFIICKPENSESFHQFLLNIEEKIYQSLKIPYRIVDVCAGDLGNPAYRKFDIEAWMPGRGEWGEITSASNCTDYQARRLGIRYKKNGKNEYVHMLNGTALAVSRTIIAILENYQQADGSVKLPEVLKPYLGFTEIRKR